MSGSIEEGVNKKGLSKTTACKLVSDMFESHPNTEQIIINRALELLHRKDEVLSELTEIHMEMEGVLQFQQKTSIDRLKIAKETIYNMIYELAKTLTDKFFEGGDCEILITNRQVIFDAFYFEIEGRILRSDEIQRLLSPLLH